MGQPDNPLSCLTTTVSISELDSNVSDHAAFSSPPPSPIKGGEEQQNFSVHNVLFVDRQALFDWVLSSCGCCLCVHPLQAARSVEAILKLPCSSHRKCPSSQLAKYSVLFSLLTQICRQSVRGVRWRAPTTTNHEAFHVSS